MVIKAWITPAIDFTIKIKLEGNTITNHNQNFSTQPLRIALKMLQYVGLNVCKNNLKKKIFYTVTTDGL
jgi:hypothetical protein